MRKRGETLDVEQPNRGAVGCEGEWRDFSRIQRWRVLRISSGVQDWCFDALRLNGEENKPLRINSARPVATPGATEASGARDFAQRASTISRLVGIGGPPSDNGRDRDDLCGNQILGARTRCTYKWLPMALIDANGMANISLVDSTQDLVLRRPA